MLLKTLFILPHLFRNVDLELIRLIGFQNKATFYMRPDMKNDRNKISNRFEFCFCLNEKVILGRPEGSSI